MNALATMFDLQTHDEEEVRSEGIRKQVSKTIMMLSIIAPRHVLGQASRTLSAMSGKAKPGDANIEIFKLAAVMKTDLAGREPLTTEELDQHVLECL